MKSIKELWAHKLEPQGRIDITIFFTNIFLIISNIFLLFIYILAHNTFMIYVDIASTIFHLCFITASYKHRSLFVGLSCLDVYLHMMFGLVSFGWHASFQNWAFAIIVATFLPAYKRDAYKPSYKMAFASTILVVISYFVFSVLIYTVDFKMYTELSPILLRTLFTFNNLTTFVSIIMYAIFYTVRSESRAYRLSRKADFDELTKMYNRYSLNQLADSIIDEAVDNNKPYSVAIFDIDFFKKVNDVYGHPTGDLVLTKLARILTSNSTRNIKSGRWGGEEFIMIAPHNVSYKAFVKKLEDIRKEVSQTKFKTADGNIIRLTISIGAHSLRLKMPLEEAISYADKNLYTAKHNGRNKLVK